MEQIKNGVKQEKQYCYSPINRRPRQSIFKEFEPTIIVPDRNMSISVIMSKYAGGQHRGLDPIYTPPDMMDMIQGIDARKLSITELHQRIDENRLKIKNMQTILQKQEQARLQREADIAQQNYREKIKQELQMELKEVPKMH